ncbi:DUF485 domain-containing protein [Streptomyces shenzhenensis]|uniref:DUF485 domain-containing protein n=1 Tax=Streptomyces shenzhenensis TaxID=943815 RepID=UPI001F3D7CAC|nr:DUF485 domain-containing protein [Streptomyces shenzhenensis]
MNQFPRPPAHHEPGDAPATAAQYGQPPVDLRELRRLRLAFGTRAAVTVVGGYLLLILLSGFAPGLMATALWGHLTFGLMWSLALFAALFLTAWRYDRHMRTRFDPLAGRLRAHRDRTAAGRGER